MSVQESFDVDEDVISQPVEDELVLLNLKNQNYYGLDDIGASMWNLLVEHRNIAAVVDRICAQYEVERTVALRDVEAMVDDFRAAGLVKSRTITSGRD